MNNRRQDVIESAHQVFSEKGYRAASIQNILDRSSISKGTLYKYFTSKSDIILAVFKWLADEIEQARDEVLLNRDPKDLNTLTEQISIQIEKLEEFKMIPLFQEIFFSDDVELKQYIKQYQLYELKWLHRRLKDIFEEETIPHLLDCAVMLTGILNMHLRYYATTPPRPGMDSKVVVQYCMNRLVELVHQVTSRNEQLLDPNLLDEWAPDEMKKDDMRKEKLEETLFNLKQHISKHTTEDERKKHKERLDFLNDELVQQTEPRTFLIDSIIESLSTDSKPAWEQQLNEFKLTVSAFLKG
ncbi:TetR/AcrR family transcriptional regulator [Alkalicoccobacillus murimartini]|uniref:AcrR family transcriptional regulator n=1 Tax=Alkalicoccobacillus murimartini TaxID=171685 RepID=A0ABT9YG60_9BACI|nr:TetR/AcrR family transcriptional regulator [Alkalicoccobacillus murimartini]MDQ0206843.1 AcrR family transcriptional regulator [Alkalicoccobacillus murimartini]